MDELGTGRVRKPKNGGGKFNILDLVIIAVVLVLIASMLFVLVPTLRKNLSGGDNIQMTYTIVFENIDENLAMKIADGQTLAEANTGRILGTVTGTPSTESCYEFVAEFSSGEGAESESGDYAKLQRVPSPVAGRVNVSVTVTATADYSEGEGYTVDGCRIACDRVYTLRLPDFAGIGRCTTFTANAG